MSTATVTANTQAPSIGRRMAGLWYRQSQNHGMFLSFTAGTRRFRIYFPSTSAST